MASKYTVGQTVHHRMFNYRGVIVGVDESYRGSDDWYEQVARSRPPKDQPWYHVLVHGAVHRTYVAERNLELDPTKTEIVHPEVALFFDRFREGIYTNSESLN